MKRKEKTFTYVCRDEWREIEERRIECERGSSLGGSKSIFKGAIGKEGKSLGICRSKSSKNK